MDNQMGNESGEDRPGDAITPDEENVPNEEEQRDKDNDQIMNDCPEEEPHPEPHVEVPPAEEHIPRDKEQLDQQQDDQNDQIMVDCAVEEVPQDEDKPQEGAIHNSLNEERIPEDKIPAEEAPANEVPVDKVSAEESPVDEIPVDEVPVDRIAAEIPDERSQNGENSSNDGRIQDQPRLDIQHMMAETIEDRRQRSRARAHLAKGLLSFQQSLANAVSSPSAPVDENPPNTSGNIFDQIFYNASYGPSGTSLTTEYPSDIPPHQSNDVSSNVPLDPWQTPTLNPSDEAFLQACFPSQNELNDLVLPGSALEHLDLTNTSAVHSMDTIASQLSSTTPSGSANTDISDNAQEHQTESIYQTSGQPNGLEWTDVSSFEDEDISKFVEIETRYKRLKNPTFADTIRYQKAKREEAIRQKCLQNRNASQDQSGDQAIFCPPSNVAESSSHGQGHGDETPVPSASSSRNKPPAKPRKKKNKISTEESRKSKQFGLEIALSQAGIKKPENSRKRKASGTDATFEANAGGSSGQKKQRRKKNQTTVDGLVAPRIVENAHINSSLPALPALTSKNKDKALAELIASIPTADQDEAKDDKKKILAASKRFNCRVRLDGKGKWKVRGLQTSLHHYQLQGAAFMRDRENSDQRPWGGLLCDTMGYGKTIQALANIVDGRPLDPDDPVRTTLVIVPAHLVTHWKSQITDHCEQDARGKVLEYHARSRFSSLDLEDDLQAYNIIITTYEEIRKSYPKWEPSDDELNEQQVAERWENIFEKQAGPLHKIKFLRIILDEGHLIRNFASTTSIAVHALTGKYKWLLSGTPLLNTIKEVYSYFRFLDVPHTGEYLQFRQNYYNPKDPQSHERLLNVLRFILFRRSQESRLFSLPIVDLPDLSEQTVEVEFCDVERKIYTLIEGGYFDEINNLAESGTRIAQYQCFLTMLLKLRMFSSHLLTAQDVVKRVLTDNVMRELTAISNKNRDQENSSYTITSWIMALRKSFVIPTKQAQSGDLAQAQLEGSPQTQPDNPARSGGDLIDDAGELIQSFQQHMIEIHEKEEWFERLDRLNCPRCGFFTRGSVIITSCKHIYCEECYYLLKNESSGPENGKPTCRKCNVIIQEAAPCEMVGDSQTEDSPSLTIFQKKKKKTNEDKQGKKKPAGLYKYGMFDPNPKPLVEENNDEPVPENDDDQLNWTPKAALHMPGAKVNKTEEFIGKWVSEKPDVKVVIFTQFMDTVQVLSAMCHRREWKHTLLNGKMPMSVRDESMRDFRDDAEMRVLIASLRAGGTGLDMTMANKCIIVDPWWNEAVEDQALCRLHRIGQDKDVEIIKMVAKDSVDDRMIALQKRKTDEINRTIGDDILQHRVPLIELIKLFGTVQENEGGTFTIIPETRKNK